MRTNWIKWSVVLGLSLCGLVIGSGLYRIEAQPRSTATAAQPQASDVPVGPDNIGGVVTSSKGPEAGVWVIAETTDLGTKFRKIVVTDDRGRYLLPELPKANYKVWVRGYGLVDSQPVQATIGQTLALTAVIAPNARAAAQYYPGNYWYSLLKIPPKSAFPMKIPPPPAEDGVERFVDCRGNNPACVAVANSGKIPSPPHVTPPGLSIEDVHNGQEVSNQAEYLFNVKRMCEDCHQMGNKVTREIDQRVGTFSSSTAAWERMLKSGQVGGEMLADVDTRFGHDAGLKLFADWSDRIAAGEVPPTPPRPQGIERNVVLSIYDFASDRAFVHDVASGNGYYPTANANGRIYGADTASGLLEWVDPVEFTKGTMKPLNQGPTPTPRPGTLYNEMPSPFWGDEIVWGPIAGGIGGPGIDSKGRLWYSGRPTTPATWCGKGSDNPYAKNFPVNPAGLVVLDPRTGQQNSAGVCGTSGSHRAWAGDKDETLYTTMQPPPRPDAGGFAWFKVRVWEETHDAEKASGWCPAVIDYNGDGKIGPYTTPDQPADPKLDRMLSGILPYGSGSNPVDGSFWVVGGVNGGPKPGIPGKIVRYTMGSNPPATCTTEVYEPPFNNPAAPGVEGFGTQGVEIDSKGIAWVSLGTSAHLASFDRSKCKVLRGPTATGQHCPEGWTLYPVPGPTFKGTDIRSDYFYLSWVDRANTLGLGNDVPVIDGTGSDSLIAYIPDQKKWVTMRVPYPMDFYTRSMGGRIDDPKAGWKGRGIWAGNNERVVWHIEGGKGNTATAVHFQIRPDPLAR